MQPNAFYSTESNQQPQIWNPQCPSQASTSSFHNQSPVILQPTQPVNARLNLQQQHILPQHSSTMPMPMVDVNNVIVKQEYPSAVPPIQSNVVQYVQHPQTALPHQLMQNAVGQQEKPLMRSLRSSNTVQSQPVIQCVENQQMSVQAAYHPNTIPVNQFPVQQQSAVLNIQNLLSPSNPTQPNTVFHQQQQPQQLQQRNVVQPNSVPANNQSNM